MPVVISSETVVSSFVVDVGDFVVVAGFNSHGPEEVYLGDFTLCMKKFTPCFTVYIQIDNQPGYSGIAPLSHQSIHGRGPLPTRSQSVPKDQDAVISLVRIVVSS